jgi:hypothetical protein
VLRILTSSRVRKLVEGVKNSLLFFFFMHFQQKGEKKMVETTEKKIISTSFRVRMYPESGQNTQIHNTSVQISKTLKLFIGVPFYKLAKFASRHCVSCDLCWLFHSIVYVKKPPFKLQHLNEQLRCRCFIGICEKVK